jgi:surface antigen bspA-like
LELSSPLTLPRSLKAVTLTGRFDDITFAGPSAITTLSSTFFIQHPNQDKGPLSTIQAQTLRLPEGLETLGARALAAGAYGYFISNQQIDLRTALNIKQLLLPSTLQSIGEAAFFSAQIQEPVTLPQRLRTIGPLAFYASSLPEITLPESLQRIDDQAFALCGSLETVRALGKTPPILGSMAFFRTTKQGRIERLIVPNGCKSAYVQAGYAPFFFDIVEAAH